MRTELGKRKLEGVSQQLHCPYLLQDIQVDRAQSQLDVTGLLLIQHGYGRIVTRNACNTQRGSFSFGKRKRGITILRFLLQEIVRESYQQQNIRASRNALATA